MKQKLTGEHRIGWRPLLAVIASALLITATAQAAVEVLGTIELSGAVVESGDVSGIGVLPHDRLLIAADEGDKVQVLRRVDALRYEVEHTADLVSGNKEADFEAVAVDGADIYVAGSHSRKRKRVKEDKKQKKNLKRLATVEPEPSRDQLLHLELGNGGVLVAKGAIDLRVLIDGDDVLSLFQPTPSKENGIDIEGLAVRGGELYVGFRGPVLRENFAPILRLEVDDPGKHELLFVQLDGGGVRGMTEVAGGLLLLSGAVGDARQEHGLYFWDGRTCVPGKDVDEPCVLKRLGDVPLPSGHDGAKAEGLALLEESEASYEVLVVYDSAPNGAPTRLRVDKL